MPISFEEKREKRVTAFATLIEIFKNHELDGIENVEVTDDAPNLIFEVYLKYTLEVIKPALYESERKLIQIFKIASNTELAVCLVEPLHHNEPALKKILNARLAFFIAFNFLLDWAEHKGSLDTSKIWKSISEDKDLSDFKDEHIKWLANLNPMFYYPIFANSQSWRLFYYIIRDKYISN